MMRPYREFAPTRFDVRGLNGEREGIADFGVFLSQTRDSDAYERSNFRIGLARLGGESESVQVHRFGHWACGWFEIIVVRAGTEAYRMAEEMLERIRDVYPLLDEEDATALEYEENTDAGMVCDEETGEWTYLKEGE
jgi:hypothetical protein